jgi:hypothetical protein
VEEIKGAQEVFANDAGVVRNRGQAAGTIPTLYFAQVGQELIMALRAQLTTSGCEEMFQEILGGRCTWRHG